jgi:hypothetical protein
MIGKHLAILATAVLISGVSPAHAAEDLSRFVMTAGTKANAAKHDALKPQAGPTDVSAAQKKKKGKSGTKGGEQYMTIKMQDAMVTSYRPSQGGRPKGPPGGGLLNYSGGSLNPNAPAPTGTPPPRPAGPVIH